MFMKRLSLINRTKIGSKTTPSMEEDVEWEMRPGGMLVQKRLANLENSIPNLMVRVSYGVARYEVSISSQATFGELKKLLTAESGLEPAEQKLVFRGKERQNGEFLDRCGVKHRSKLILIDDPESKVKRLIEMSRNAKILAALAKIDGVCAEINTLAEQVFVIEKSIASGKKVAEVQITTLIEMLMRQAVKLDYISVEGDPCAAQKNLQGRRVQKCVETLDILKVSNKKITPVVVRARWETFDPPLSQTSSAKWEYFD